MSFFDKILGQPLTARASKQQELSVLTGVPALGLDALASIAYGPEAALMILLPLGLVGLHYFFLIAIAIVVTLIILYFSYRQTIAAYPGGGGAYIVASDNLGKRVGLWAAVALLLDYLLNVAVGISAGVGAVVSAIPALYPYTLVLCLFVLLMLTILNLRGIRESGLAFATPTIVFVVCMGIVLIMGLMHSWQHGGHPQPVIAPPVHMMGTATLSIWLLLCAFTNGLTAMTGVEAVSNATPLFRKPVIKNAQWTLTAIIIILALFLLAISYLGISYRLTAMDESHPAYQNILSQLIAAVIGKNVFYYFSMVSVFIVLTYSAQTSFSDFPRVCRLLAEDGFLPSFFSERGRRLVYSHGIVILAIFSAFLLILFKGITDDLIPLFAIGAFSAFLFSQTGMAAHWWRKRSHHKVHIKLFFNALGAITTAVALIIIMVTKFKDGAWMIIVVAPALVLLLMSIKRHYQKIAREIGEPLPLRAEKLQSPLVIVPVYGLNRVSEKAIRFALLLAGEVIAVHIKSEKDRKNTEELKKFWNEKIVEPAKTSGLAVPRLEIINSPYRQIYKPLLNFVKKIKKQNPKYLIAVVIPELIQPRWYEYLLHNIRAKGLRFLLFLERDHRTVVITTPWYRREEIVEK